MAYQYEVDKIRELCDEIEQLADEVRGMLPEEATEDLDSIDEKLDGIRSEVDDVEGYTEYDPDEVRRGLEDIIYTATNMQGDL